MLSGILSAALLLVVAFSGVAALTHAGAWGFLTLMARRQARARQRALVLGLFFMLAALFLAFEAGLHLSRAMEARP